MAISCGEVRLSRANLDPLDERCDPIDLEHNGAIAAHELRALTGLHRWNGGTRDRLELLDARHHESRIKHRLIVVVVRVRSCSRIDDVASAMIDRSGDEREHEALSCNDQARARATPSRFWTPIGTAGGQPISSRSPAVL